VGFAVSRVDFISSCLPRINTRAIKARCLQGLSAFQSALNRFYHILS